MSALLWMLITIQTGFQIGWMAVGVGIVVGYSVRLSVRWQSNLHGLMAAGFALFGCALGNGLSAIVMIAQEDGFSASLAISNMDRDSFWMAMQAFFMPVDIVFYLLALTGGFSIGRGSNEEAPKSPWLSRCVVALVVVAGAGLIALGFSNSESTSPFREVRAAVRGLSSKVVAPFFVGKEVEIFDQKYAGHCKSEYVHRARRDSTVAMLGC